MPRCTRRYALITAAWLLTIPAAAYAQASITGVVKDPSGAVLPGVTVEAASPALIEKVRTVVTDGTGQYRIESLRPGLFTVTFTLSGFATFRREGIELTGTFTATVNAELRVGALQETVTVTGEAPIVDIQGTTRQRVVDREVLDTIPASRNVFNIADATIPGITTGAGQRGRRDVGGVRPGEADSSVSAIRIHGSRDADQMVFQNGVQMTGSAREGFNFPGQQNPAGTQEATFDTTAVSAEHGSGGVRVNIIPRDGGNIFAGTFFASFTNEDLQSGNLNDDLQARGLGTANRIKKVWDVNPGFGGPIRRDRLWFYLSARYAADEGFVAGMFHDRNANNPNAFTFDPDLSRPARTRATFPEEKLRLTWQATPKNKLGLTWQEQSVCLCPAGISLTVAPEAATRRTFPVLRIVQGDWTSPITSRLLLEAGVLRNFGRSNADPLLDANPSIIPVQEQSTGLRFRAAETFRTQPFPSTNLRGAVSYITGAHAFKFGVTHRNGFVDFSDFDFQPVSYRFNLGVPNQLTQRAIPSRYKGEIDHDLGLFAQDKWTLQRLALSYGVRYDYFTNSFPAISVGPARLAPTRNITFPAQENLSWHDITPKLGGSYDLFGTGKTAVKVTLNKYVENLGGGFLGDTSVISGAHAVNALVLSTNRSWTDANRDFVPDCDLTNPAANGECGRMANTNFGKSIRGRTFDPDVLSGWGNRGNQWEFSAGVQHEVLPRVAVDVSYFRRWFGNFLVTDNRAVDPADFDPFSITAPQDPDLPDGGGFVIPGLFDLNPAKFGVPADNFVTFAKNFGKQIERWNGVDITVNARPRAGVLLQGGLSTGRTTTDNCDVVVKLDNPSPRFCRVETDFLERIKFLGSYTIPRVDVQVAGVFQSLPGPEIAANFNAPNAQVAPSLGRSLSGGARNVRVNLVEPGTLYGERLHQFDLRLAKMLRLGRTRTRMNVDLFNAFNANPVTLENPNFGAFRQPTEILPARFVRLSAQFDF